MSAEDTKRKKATEDRSEAGNRAPENQAAAPDTEGLTAPEEELARLRAENSALADRLLRQAAEFENFRKRMFRERDEGVRYANALLLTDLLPVIDDFERAIASAEESRDFDSFHSGVALIERQLVSLLERGWGLRRFTVKCGKDGEAFDPEKHEAIAVEQSTEVPEGTVLENYQKGYILHDRVLRPAKVKVAKAATK